LWVRERERAARAIYSLARVASRRPAVASLHVAPLFSLSHLNHDRVAARVDEEGQPGAGDDAARRGDGKRYVGRRDARRGEEGGDALVSSVLAIAIPIAIALVLVPSPAARARARARACAPSRRQAAAAAAAAVAVAMQGGPSPGPGPGPGPCPFPSLLSRG
jgi:hypothetical protein